jgi:Protein of unknown function (DUF3365)
MWVAVPILSFLPVIAWARPLEDTSETCRLLAILLEAGRSAIATSDVFQRLVVEDFQQRTGITLTNLEAAQIPAIDKPLLSRLMEESKKTIHSGRQLPLASNRGPVPDKVLSEFTDDGKYVRVLLPLFYKRACLACHGEPKGQRDISGYPREGAKEGERGGAINVKISPLQ